MVPSSNEITLKEALKRLISEYRLNDGLTRMKITVIWEKTTGPYISRHTEKVLVKNRVLFVYLTSASLRNELSYSKKQLLDTINKALGTDYLEDIVFR
ncbi:MAG: hypothetical protein Kow00127_02010 [Bacteroidales bacterium]